MARPLWTGSLSFGLVNVPVTLVAAVRDVDLHFRQLHAADGAPIDVQRWCSEEDVEVPFEEVTRSYELDDGTQVTVTDEDLEAVEPRKTRTIDIEQFVEVAEVDPVFFDHPYFLVPASGDDGGVRAYRLLVEVMSRTGRAALGRFVMRAKEYLAIVRAQPEDASAAADGDAGGGADGQPAGGLSLTTMLFSDEVRDAADLDAATDKRFKPSAKQLDAAVAVIEELSAPWRPDSYRDCYRERLEQVIARKRQGETVKAPEAESEPAPATDLMEALERTLADMQSDRS